MASFLGIPTSHQWPNQPVRLCPCTRSGRFWVSASSQTKAGVAQPGFPLQRECPGIPKNHRGRLQKVDSLVGSSPRDSDTEGWQQKSLGFNTHPRRLCGSHRAESQKLATQEFPRNLAWKKQGHVQAGESIRVGTDFSLRHKHNNFRRAVHFKANDPVVTHRENSRKSEAGPSQPPLEDTSAAAELHGSTFCLFVCSWREGVSISTEGLPGSNAQFGKSSVC